MGAVGLGIGIGSASCHLATPAPREVIAVASPIDLEGGAGARAGFVVQSPTATLIVPIDPGQASIELPGIWSFSGDRVGVRVDVEITTVVRAGALAVGVCSDAPDDHACVIDPERGAGDVRVELELRGSEPHWRVSIDGGDPCTCIAIPGISDDEVHVASRASAEEEEHEEDEEDCDSVEEGYVVVGVLDGVVYSAGESHDECYGRNIYDGTTSYARLHADADVLDRAVPRRAGCDTTGSGDFSTAAILREPDFVLGAREDACPSDEVGEIEAFLLHRGQLVHVVGAVTTVADTCMCAATEPVSPGNCPSASAPCGDPRMYPGITQHDDFWIATDGQAALVLDGDRLAVLARRNTASRSIAAPDSIVGVEFLAELPAVDPGAVPKTVRLAMPTLASEDARFIGTAAAWGDRCVVHLRADRLDAAEAACFAGLRAGGSGRTRGALTYNLGRVAEARGQPKRALSWYRRSLRLRPGNATVVARIELLTDSSSAK